MMNNLNTNKIQYFAIAGSLLLFLFIIELIRRKKIREEFSLLWLMVSIVFVIFSFWRNGIEKLADFVGIAYSPSAFILVLIMAIFLILIQFSIIISKLSKENQKLIQEIALLKKEKEK